MWLTLALAVMAGIVILYVPGYFFARSFSIDRPASVIMAPPFTSFVTVVLGVVLHRMGVRTSGVALFVLATAVCVCLLGASAFFRRWAGHDSASLLAFDDNGEALKHLAWYIGVAAFVTFIIFVMALDGPNAFSRHDDSTLHLSAVRGFVQTGTYSTLNVSAYLDQGVAGSYYPAAWHVAAAQIASLFGGDPVVSTNALTLVFLIFVFPSALFLLINTLFPDAPRVRACGALFSLAFSGFPWGFLVWGQLLSNLISYVYVPLVMVLVIEGFRAAEVGDRVKFGLASVVGLLSVVLGQPNGAFTLGIWAVVFVLSFIAHPSDDPEDRIDVKRMVGMAVFFALAWLMWVVVYRSSFMQGVLAANWGALGGLAKEILMALLFKFGPREGIHPFLSVVVLVGVIRTLKNRQYLWLTVAYAFALLLVTLDMGTDGPLKSFLTGFWYTDYYRTGGMATLFALPIAAYGFEWIVSWCSAWYARHLAHEGETPDGSVAPGEGQPRHLAHGGQTPSTRSTWIVVGVLVVVMAFCELAPFKLTIGERTYTPGLRRVHSTLKGFYSWQSKLTGEEDRFVRKALQQIPEGALIVNVPRDGSCNCYAVEGANVFFRRTHTTGRVDEEASEIVRLRMRDFVEDEEVQKVVADLGIRYVLLLDREPSENPTTIKMRYKPEDWYGIETIDENTPGFTLVASEGDMRLFAVDAA